MGMTSPGSLPTRPRSPSESPGVSDSSGASTSLDEVPTLSDRQFVVETPEATPSVGTIDTDVATPSDPDDVGEFDEEESDDDYPTGSDESWHPSPRVGRR